jgi:hypothetical protein
MVFFMWRRGAWVLHVVELTKREYEMAAVELLVVGTVLVGGEDVVERCQ